MHKFRLVSNHQHIVNLRIVDKDYYNYVYVHVYHYHI